MKVPLEWLKDYVPIRLKPQALAERLTMAGLEVVGIHEVNGEPVLDLEITPNRADCLSIIGIAREAAAVTGQRLKLPTAKGQKPQASRKSPARQPSTQLSIHIDDHKGCHRYIGRLIEGVRVGPSPEWLAKRLRACGTRPINNIVDVTNYVLLEYGQPLHAFDFARLAGGMIRVRRAKPNERLHTLDSIERRLESWMLVISDASQAVAIAGVMGGQGSEVGPGTSAVLLESAWFDPITVRRTARALGLSTESSYRFERGVDLEGVEAASARAAQLIRELAGGAVTDVRDVGRRIGTRTRIALETGQLNRWLGTTLQPSELRTTLARASCRVASAGSSATLHVEVPSFRRDLTQAADLAEEVARLHGYERIRARVPVAPVIDPATTQASDYQRRQILACLCAGLGLTEFVTWSLIAEADLSRFGFEVPQALRLTNPLSLDHALLRPSLIPGLVQVVRRNLTQSVGGVRGFELGTVFSAGSASSAWRLGLVLSGVWQRDWQARESADFFRLKGLVEAIVQRACGAALTIEPASVGWAQPGEAARLAVGGRPLGTAGQVRLEATQALDVDEPVWVAELAVEELLRSADGRARTQPLPAFPPVKRDLSLLVSQEHPFAQIDAAVRETAGPRASRIELIDRYTGRGVPSGQHSLTFSIEYRDPAKTLTAEEAEMLHRQIGQVLVSRFGATLR